MLTKREENQSLVIERKVLLTIYGPRKVDSVYRSRYNFKLDRKFNSSNVIGVEVLKDRQNQKKTEIQVKRWREQR
jgi:hypothetical protein